MRAVVEAWYTHEPVDSRTTDGLGGGLALLVLFVPMGLYLAREAMHSEEQWLGDQGLGLGRTLAGQITDAVLLGDRLGLHDALVKAARGAPQVRYIAVVDAGGSVVAHTFEDGCPLALGERWRRGEGGEFRFRVAEGPWLDVCVPILSGQLGALHVGLSRVEAVRAMARATWTAGAALFVALGTALVGSRLVASRVSQPLRRLEAVVSRYPGDRDWGQAKGIGGTREIATLSEGIAAMGERLQELEGEQAATQERMIHTERLAALGELAAGLAHEIHNPLDGMLECLRYLEADPAKSSRGDKYYPMMRDGLQRIARVMQGMLTFARWGQRITLETCSVGEAMEELELLVRQQLEGRRVQLTWRVIGECSCLADRHGLSQVVLNLVLNAADAAEDEPQPAVHVEVTCDATWVYVVCDDNGPGVPQDLRERIFEPFFTTKPRGKGTGLGLSVSRQTIRAGGGEILLSPGASPLGGARFTIRLPKVACAEASDACNACAGPYR